MPAREVFQLEHLNLVFDGEFVDVAAPAEPGAQVHPVLALLEDLVARSQTPGADRITAVQFEMLEQRVADAQMRGSRGGIER